MCVSSPSKVKAGYRVPTRPPTLTSVVIVDGPLVVKQLTVVADAQAAVAHAAASMRALGVLSLEPKLSPVTVTVFVIVRALLATPRKLTAGAFTFRVCRC